MITPCVDLAETNPPIYLGGSRSSDSQTASHPCSTMSRFVFVVFVFVFVFLFVFVFVFVVVFEFVFVSDQRRSFGHLLLGEIPP